MSWLSAICRPAIQRPSLTVAAALRPILEAFMRVAHPSGLTARHDAWPFHNILQQRLSGPNQLLKATDIAELRALLDYANRFHHDTNAA